MLSSKDRLPTDPNELDQGYYSKYLNNELRSLKEKVEYLADKMNKRDTPERLNTHSGSFGGREKIIHKYEKQLKSLENSVHKSSSKDSFSSDSPKIGKFKSKLIEMRQQNNILKKENDSLQFKIKFKNSTSEKAKALQEEIIILKNSIKRSENIRRQQKKIISVLKNGLNKPRRSSSNLMQETSDKPKKSSQKTSKKGILI